MAKADTEFLDVLCLHETTIMKYMDIMVKYPREPDKLQAMLEKDVENNECVQFPETRLPINERKLQLPPIKMPPDTSYVLELVRVRTFWGINVIKQYEA